MTTPIIQLLGTWEAKEKLGLGDAPFLLRPTPPPAAWDPFRFRRLFAGFVASKGCDNYIFVDSNIFL